MVVIAVIVVAVGVIVGTGFLAAKGRWPALGAK